MLIQNGLVVTAEAHRYVDVRIEGEKITAVAPGLVPLPGEECIDARGLLVLPGGVDVHTHFDLLVGGLRATDSFQSGSIAAACGGTTCIVDHMAFGPVGADLLSQVEVYHGLADGQAVIDYGFHGVVGHVDDAILADMAALRDMGIPSIKFYMTYDQHLDDSAALSLLKRANELGMLICAHAENDAMVNYWRARFVGEGKTSAWYHAKSRPDYAEAEAVYRLLSLALAADNAPVYVVHTSTAAALEAALALKVAMAANSTSPHSQAIFETCPQYLLLDESRYQQDNNEGLKYVMSPPLRSLHDQEALWQAVLDGRIATIGTDHCPFFFARDKMLGADDFTKCPNGIPGVELRMAQMYSEAVVKRGLSLENYVRLTATDPARIFGLFPEKGTIAVGSDADILLLDPNRQVTVKKALLHENVDYTPYEGQELTGWPLMTFGRGELIARDGRYVGAAGRGRFIKRHALQLPV